MVKLRTKKEIQKMVKALKAIKAKTPKQSFFNDDNHAMIDAQIAVMQGKKKPDDYYVDETSEDYQDGDNELWGYANRAEQWLKCEITDEEIIEEWM